MSEFEKCVETLEGDWPRNNTEQEARDKALDALAFVESLHQLFKDTGMTTSEEPDVNELENLIDALYGELGAAVLFLCEPSFSRVPDMLRSIGKSMEKMEDSNNVVPPTIVKGFSRIAKRIENTRQNQQQMAKVTSKVSDSA
jgi:hypothetical protein